MSITPTALGKDVSQILKYGNQVRFKYYDATIAGAGSYYDDDVSLAQSGNDLFVSGLFQPLDKSRGSTDALLVEQGRLLDSDSKIYIDGGVNTSGVFKIGIGSPTTGQEYRLIDNGVVGWEVGGSVVYKKLYIRTLTTGSLLGE